MQENMLDAIAIKSMVKGMLTFIPGWQWLRKKQVGGANSARYCYSVWLRHRTLAARCGFPSQPETVAEMGPGDSIGAGLAALLSGCKVYMALDIFPSTTLERNVRMLDEMVELFRKRATIPDDEEFPNLHPRLENYGFPAYLYSDGYLRNTLEEGRIRAIRGALMRGVVGTKGMVDIRYVAPWDAENILKANSIDMIFSQAVMEHVDDLHTSYRAMYQWLKPGGIISHEIDFKSHGTAKHWNGHWAYPEPIWKIIKGRRPYFLNRQTCGHHLDIMQQSGFEIVYVKRQEKAQCIQKADLCSGLRNTCDDDLVTSSAILIACKR